MLLQPVTEFLRRPRPVTCVARVWRRRREVAGLTRPGALAVE